MNGNLKDRYFPSYRFNPTQSPDCFATVKEPGTFRIFCLGASTTVGYPYWYNAAFSSFLRDRFHAVFPEKKIEVVNFGMTATNSYTVNDMARDLISYQPDLLIVYDGHNEFYGALGIASNESLGGMRWLTTLYLRMIHYRTFAALKDFYGFVRRSMNNEHVVEGTGTLMERLSKGQYVPYESGTYKRGLEIFRENLKDLAALCAEHKIPVIVSSQVSNLRHQAPFVSDDGRIQSPDEKTRFDRLLRRGREYLIAGRVNTALEFLRAALAIDSLHAEAHYRVGECLDRLRRIPEARTEFMRARDLDQLRFRTSTDFNLAVKEEAARGKMIFADIEGVFAAASPDSIIGKEIMFEHLHPRSRGHFLMAKEYARLIRQQGLLASMGEWEARDTVRDEWLWRNRSLTELDERVAMRKTEILISGWPFKPGYPTVDEVDDNDTLGQIAEQYTRGRWNWKQAHEAAANVYEQHHDLLAAEKEYRLIINQLPLLEVDPYLNLAKVMLDQKKIGEVREVLLSSLAIRPTMLAYRALGDIALRAGRPQEAVQHYERLLSFNQSAGEQAENGYLLALAYSQAKKNDLAAARLLTVLGVKPDYKPAVDLLARIRAQK